MHRYRLGCGELRRLALQHLLDHWVSEEALEDMFLREKAYYQDDPEYVEKYQIAFVSYVRITELIRSLVNILNRHPEITDLNLGDSRVHMEEACLLSRLQYVRRLNLKFSGIGDRFHPLFTTLLAMEAYRPWLSFCENALFLGKNRQARTLLVEQMQTKYPEMQKQLNSTALIEVNGAQRIEKEVLEEVLGLIRDEAGKYPGVAPLLGDFTYLNPDKVDEVLGDLKALPAGHFDQINLEHTLIEDSTCRYLLRLHNEGDPRAPTFVKLFEPEISPDVYQQIREAFEDPEDPLFRPPISRPSVFTQPTQPITQSESTPASRLKASGCTMS